MWKCGGGAELVKILLIIKKFYKKNSKPNYCPKSSTFSSPMINSKDIVMYSGGSQKGGFF